MTTPESEPHAALAIRVVELAGNLGLRIAVAESLTGGRLADALVSVPGVSKVFSGGIVSYDTALKRSLLGVDEKLLDLKGPVDPEVASQMAAGARRACAIIGEDGSTWEADIGVATTGVAGPDPDAHTGQPPGTVWVAVDSSGGQSAWVRGLAGGQPDRRPSGGTLAHDAGVTEARSGIRNRAVEAALTLLVEVLEHLETEPERT
ncbi:MAG: CinA family protein [Leucobacter sp.]